MPRVSVLLPYHNADALSLKHTIDIIMYAESRDLELVLVNNANDPDDEAVRLARAESQLHSRITHIHEPEKGIAHALNTGLQHCTGEYIARMDADDLMEPYRLQMQSEYLDANPGIGLVSGLVEHCSDLPGSDGYAEYVKQINSWITEEDIYFHRFVESPFAHPSVMFRRELLEKYGDYSTAPVPEDYELWLRWMHHGVRMGKINLPVLKWFDHASRLSRTHPNCRPGAFDAVRYHYLARWLEPRLSSLSPIYVWGGKLARKKARLLEAQGIKISGYIDVKQPGGKDTFMHFMDIPQPGQMFIISMVSNRGKYAEIRDFLLKRGYEFERDFVLAG